MLKNYDCRMREIKKQKINSEIYRDSREYIRYENSRQEDSANPGNIIARRKLRVEGNVRRPLRCRSHGMHAKIREKVSFSIPLLCMSHFIKFSVTSAASRFVCDYEQLVYREVGRT